MPLDVPLTLGPFVVDPTGGLSPSTPESFPSFRLRWRGHQIQARLAAGRKDGALALHAVLGRVRSTGRPEISRAQPRQLAFAMLRTLPHVLPPDWTVTLMPDHTIATEAHIQLSLPTRAEVLLTELTLFLFRLAPYLDLLAEGAGMESVAEDGNENTWPG